MKRRIDVINDFKLNPSKSIKYNNKSDSMYDDILTNIFPFLNWNEIIINCSLVCKQWYNQCCKIPLSIKISRGSTCLTMFKSKLLSNLTKLDASECHRLEDFVSLDGIRELANCEYMTNLKSLIFLANDINDECCKLIATSPYLKNLTELDCSECHEIGLVGNEYLVNSENCKNMRIFKLESCHNENMIGAFKVIATGKYFSNLTDLTISDLMTKEEKLEDLSRFTQLKSLNVSMNSYSNIKALTRNEYVNYLTSLDFSENSLGREGCMDIANCKHLNQLTYLNLSYNDIGEGLVDLCNSPNMINLKSLIISYNYCTQQSCKYLCESKYITNLTFLDISNNSIKKDGVKMITQSPNLANLNRLYIEECDCDDSFTIISNSQFANQLKILEIDNLDWNLRDKFNSLEKLIISNLNVDSMEEIIVLFEKILPKLQVISYNDNGRDFFQRDVKSGEIIPTKLGLNLFEESSYDESDDEE